MRKCMRILALATCLPFTVFAQAEDVTRISPFSVALHPGMSIPVGSLSAYSDVAMRTNLRVAYNLPFLPLLALTLDGGYNLLFAESAPSRSILYATLGTGFDIGLGKFTVSGRVSAGVAQVFSHVEGAQTGGDMAITALGGAEVAYRMILLIY